MVPNFIPGPLQERAAWFENFANQFAIVGTSLGFVAADVTAVTNDNADFQFCASATVEIESFAKAFRQYRRTLTEGNIGDRTPAYPPNPVTAPPNSVPTGIFERLDRLVARIRASPTYTTEIGALLGILPATTVRPAPDDMQPTLKAVSLPGSVVQVKFVRGFSVGVVIETKLDNSDTWVSAGQFQSSPATLVIPNNPENLPRAVQLRARYVERNSPVGQYSAVVSTATQPSD